MKCMAMDQIPGLKHFRDAVGSCPEVDQIMLHKTEQYPLPGMNHDESSIDETIKVLETIKKKTRMGPSNIEKHGLMFADGDILLQLLADTVGCMHFFNILLD
jgi:hypothetical protein